MGGANQTEGPPEFLRWVPERRLSIFRKSFWGQGAGPALDGMSGESALRVEHSTRVPWPATRGAHSETVEYSAKTAGHLTGGVASASRRRRHASRGAPPGIGPRTRP